MQILGNTIALQATLLGHLAFDASYRFVDKDRFQVYIPLSSQGKNIDLIICNGIINKNDISLQNGAIKVMSGNYSKKLEKETEPVFSTKVWANTLIAKGYKPLDISQSQGILIGDNLFMVGGVIGSGANLDVGYSVVQLPKELKIGAVNDSSKHISFLFSKADSILVKILITSKSGRLLLVTEHDSKKAAYRIPAQEKSTKKEYVLVSFGVYDEVIKNNKSWRFTPEFFLLSQK